VDLSAEPNACICPHCSMNNGMPCMLEAARRNVATQKPSVDHLQLSQLGMSRRLLNPQLYELHDETTWTTDTDAQPRDMMEKSAIDSVDELTSETVSDKVHAPELNGQSTSDQEEIWSDCTAELPQFDNKKLAIGFSMENLNSFCAEKTDSDVGEGELAEKTIESLKTDAECQLAPIAKSGKEVSTKSDPPEPATTNCVSVSSTSCGGGIVTETVTATAVGQAACAVTTKPTTRTTACTTSSTTTASSSKSERPRVSPCHATQTKLMPPVANGRDAKLPCKAAAAAKQSSPFSNAEAAKLLVDMVGRPKSTSSPGGQCKLTQCVDRIHTDPVGTAADNGSCSGEKTSRVSAAPGTSCTAEGRKDGGKFCECWHCEFFGHMSVS